MTRTLNLAALVVSFVLLLPGCFLFGGGDSADGNSDGGSGGGLGDPCKSNSGCKMPFICDAATKTCQAMADRKEGEPCTFSVECATSLYCSPLGVCAKSGKAMEGESCGKEGDCVSGLTCAVDGLYGKCVKPGKGSVGAAC